jgi:hypothetical protein
MVEGERSRVERLADPALARGSLRDLGEGSAAREGAARRLLTPAERVQAAVDRLLATLLAAAVAEAAGNDEGTLAGFIVGATFARDAYLTSPAGAVFDALAQLGAAVRDHYDEELGIT